MAVLGDYDVWYKVCQHCGYDTGRSISPKHGNKRCWRCGRPIERDYTARALKKKTLLRTTSANQNAAGTSVAPAVQPER